MLGKELLKIQFFNTWGGSLWDRGLREHFIESTLQDTHIFGLQEVHLNMVNDRLEFVRATNTGHRIGPILTSQLNQLHHILNDYRWDYAEHAWHCLSDVEPTDLPISFGNAVFVRKDLQIVGQRTALVYGQFNQINDENGTFCARKIQGVIVMHNNHPYLIFNIHGIWTGNGKGDCPARDEQTANINQFMSEMFDQCCRDTGVVPKIVLGGDFNLSADTRAFLGLMQGKVFGDGGAVNLNQEFDIRDTRTSWYPKTKPSREADYVLISRNTKVHSFVAPSEPAVSDHRPLILEVE